MLWLWCRMPAAAAIQPLAWETPYAAGAALKTKRKEGRKEGRKEKERNTGRQEGRKEGRNRLTEVENN